MYATNFEFEIFNLLNSLLIGVYSFSDVFIRFVFVVLLFNNRVACLSFVEQMLK